MQDIVRRLNPITFGFAALCFLLSFADLKDQPPPRSVSGMDVVVSSVAYYWNELEAESPVVADVVSHPNALYNNSLISWLGCLPALAFLATTLAFILGFVASNTARIARLSLAGVALVSLILLRIFLEQSISGFAHGAAPVEGGVGLWMAVGFFMGGLAINLVHDDNLEERLAAASVESTGQDIESNSMTSRPLADNINAQRD